MILDLRPKFEDKVKQLVRSPEMRTLFAKYGLTVDCTRNLKIIESAIETDTPAELDKDVRLLVLDSGFLDSATDEQIKEVLYHELAHYLRSEAGLEGHTEGGEGPDNPDEFAILKDDVDLKRMQGKNDSEIREYLTARFKDSPLSDEQMKELLKPKTIRKRFGYDKPPHIEMGSVRELTVLSFPLGMAYKLIKKNSADKFILIKDALCDFLDKMSMATDAIKNEVYPNDKNRVARFRDAMIQSSELLKSQDFHAYSTDNIFSFAEMIRQSALDFVTEVKYIDAKFGFLSEQLKRIETSFDRYNSEHGVVLTASLKTHDELSAFASAIGVSATTKFVGDWTASDRETIAMAKTYNQRALHYFDGILSKLGYTIENHDRSGDYFVTGFRSTKSPSLVQFELQSFMKAWYMGMIREIELLPNKTQEDIDYVHNLVKQTLEKMKSKASVDFNKMHAAIRDPQTGEIFVGDAHADIIETLIKTQRMNEFMRVVKEYRNSTSNVGFVEPDGTFISRDEAEKKYGFRTSQELELRKQIKKSASAEGLIKLLYTITDEDIIQYVHGVSSWEERLSKEEIDDKTWKHLLGDVLAWRIQTGKGPTMHFARDPQTSAYEIDQEQKSKILMMFKNLPDSNTKTAFMKFVADLPNSSIDPNNKYYNEMTLTPEERKPESAEMFTRSQNPDYALSPANRNEYSHGSEGKAPVNVEFLREILDLDENLMPNQQKVTNEEADKESAVDVQGCHFDQIQRDARIDPLLEAYPENSTGERTFQNPEEGYPEGEYSARPKAKDGGLSGFLKALPDNEDEEKK